MNSSTFRSTSQVYSPDSYIPWLQTEYGIDFEAEVPNTVEAVHKIGKVRNAKHSVCATGGDLSCA